MRAELRSMIAIRISQTDNQSQLRAIARPYNQASKNVKKYPFDSMIPFFLRIFHMTMNLILSLILFLSVGFVQGVTHLICEGFSQYYVDPIDLHALQLRSTSYEREILA